MEDPRFKFLAKHIVLSEEEKELLIDLSIFKSYKKGAVLLKEGEFAKESYTVLSGCIRQYYMQDGDEKTTAFYIEEESVSPESLINNEPSTYYLSCEQDTTALIWTQEMEQIVFDKFPKFETLCRKLSEKELAKSQASFAQYINSTPEERYTELMQKRPELFSKVPQYQIASYLGVTPESLSRIRKRKILRLK
ncbi:MAG: Crp/Fnr family transcriptional regulator [Flavipsychrobacter sp.]